MKKVYLTFLLLFSLSASSYAIAPITGDTVLCLGTTAYFSDSTPGGSWTCDDTSIIKIDLAGKVIPKVAGIVTIYYFVGLISVTKTITVRAPIPVITGPTHVCVGETITLSDTLTAGRWSSSDTMVAIINSVGFVHGKSKDSVFITYSYSGCTTNTVIYVDSIRIPAPVIAGPTHLCIGSTITLSDTLTHGRWSSSDTVIATIDSFGLIHGKRRDSVLLTYSYYSGCTTREVIYVDSIPVPAQILGPSEISPCYPVYFMDSVPAGIWSVSNNLVGSIDTDGHFTIRQYGTDTVIYTITSKCGTNFTSFSTTSYSCEGVKVIRNNAIIFLQIIPNPNKGFFSTNVRSDKNEPADIMISDLLGRELKKFTTVANRSFDVKLDLRPGVYLISAITARGNYVERMVVE